MDGKINWIEHLGKLLVLNGDTVGIKTWEFLRRNKLTSFWYQNGVNLIFFKIKSFLTESGLKPMS